MEPSGKQVLNSGAYTLYQSSPSEFAVQVQLSLRGDVCLDGVGFLRCNDCCGRRGCYCVRNTVNSDGITNCNSKRSNQYISMNEVETGEEEEEEEEDGHYSCNKVQRCSSDNTISDQLSQQCNVSESNYKY